MTTTTTATTHYKHPSSYETLILRAVLHVLNNHPNITTKEIAQTISAHTCSSYLTAYAIECFNTLKANQLR